MAATWPLDYTAAESPDETGKCAQVAFCIGTATALSQALARAHPREPHWYLFAIGVDPAWQGKGLASALLRSRLDQCDRAGLRAYLEASKATSVPLYQHFGFEPTGNPELPAGAPQLTAMWRSPVAAP